VEFLSYVAGLTKRKKDILDEAERLAGEGKTIEGLEKEMEKMSSSLVSAIKGGKINSSEFFRSVADQTIISSLAAVFLGSRGSKPYKTMEDEFPAAVLRIQPLSKFYVDFLHFQNSDNFEEEEWGGASINADDEYYGMDEDGFGSEGDDPSAPPASWGGVEQRVNRYLTTPVYGWYNRGEMRKNSRLGYKEMRRVTRKDKRVCPECVNYEQQGWKPIGSLPSPGIECRCYDRCRCSIEYR
jgi:hypothetical protein